MVADLTAHFRIKRRMIEHGRNLFALCRRSGRFALIDDRQHLGAFSQCFITVKTGFDRLVQAKILALPAKVAHFFSVLAGALALLVHQAVKFRAVGGHPLFFQNLKRQIDREAIGVIKLECVRCGQFLAVCRRNAFVQNRQAAVNGFVEACLLVFNYLVDIFLFFDQL